MERRAVLYIGRQSLRSETPAELLATLAIAMEAAGAIVVATFVEDGKRRGRGPQTAWNRLLADLAAVDQIVVATVGDLPGWTVADLLCVLDILRQAGVSLYCNAERITTDSGASAILDLITAYRRSKVGQAVRRGQERARGTGTHIGRPPIPEIVRRRVKAALAAGGGIRPTAKKFGISPASVINIRRVASEESTSEAVAA